jgi:outer membrane lipoprotein-sorting protein
MKKCLAGWIVLMVFSSAALGGPPSGEEILRLVDENMVADQAVSLSEMVIHGRTGTRHITSRAWVKGRNKSFVEFLSPPREAGKKMLKLEDKIWNYTPEPSDRIIAISGHLLRQSVMGSDLSYEDITENDNLRELYDAVVEGTDTLENRPCYVLNLSARQEGVTYHSRKIWVDSDRWVPLKEERFAKSGKLLKTTAITEVFQVDGRWYPKRMIFKDMLAKGGGTEYLIHSIDFAVDIPDEKMTKAALRK